MTGPLPAVHSGPLLILINAGAGRADTAAIQATIEGVLRPANRSYRIVLVKDPTRLAQIAREAVVEAKACGGAVVVSGGDGTIHTVANALLGSGCPMAVLPQGTFNYFGRVHGIPEDLEQATRVLLNARPHPVQVGLLNGKLFLVNASLGLYPKLLEDRETYTKLYGRSRLVALCAGLMTVLHWKRPLRLTLEGHGVSTSMKTFTLFVGNNRLQLEQTGIPLAQALQDGQLAAVALRPVATLGMLWLVLRGAFNRLGDADNVVTFSFTRLIVKRAAWSHRRRVKVAMDGEIHRLRTPLVFMVSPEPLLLLMPETADPPSTVAVTEAGC